jgi:hypothetical protein
MQMVPEGTSVHAASDHPPPPAHARAGSTERVDLPRPPGRYDRRRPGLEPQALDRGVGVCLRSSPVGRVTLRGGAADRHEHGDDRKPRDCDHDEQHHLLFHTMCMYSSLRTRHT